MKASLLIHREQVLKDGNYLVVITVYQVEQSKKFPDGVKVRFLLKNVVQGFARLLVDNHQPFGFHMHTQLPDNHEHREILVVKDYLEALDFFWLEVERIIANEEK
jgi:hypothetical protein